MGRLLTSAFKKVSGGWKILSLAEIRSTWPAHKRVHDEMSKSIWVTLSITPLCFNCQTSEHFHLEGTRDGTLLGKLTSLAGINECGGPTPCLQNSYIIPIITQKLSISKCGFRESVQLLLKCCNAEVQTKRDQMLFDGQQRNQESKTYKIVHI